MLNIALLILPLIIGYFIGLSLKPKHGIAITIVSFLGLLAYINFISPSVALIFAYFGHIILLTYCVGLLIGILARIFANKGWALFTTLITLSVLTGSIFYSLQLTESDRESEKKLNEDKLLAQEFIKNNPGIIAVAGENFKVFLSTYSTNHGEKLPYRYELFISGLRKFEAIVDVSRTSGHPSFKLACITSLSIGYRDLI